MKPGNKEEEYQAICPSIIDLIKMQHIYLVGMFSHGGGQLLTLVNNPELHWASFLVVTLFGSLKTRSNQFYLTIFSTEKITNVIFTMSSFTLS